MSFNLQSLPQNLDDTNWKEAVKGDMHIYLWALSSVGGHEGNPPYSGLVLLHNTGNYHMTSVNYRLVIDDNSRPWNPYFTDLHGNLLHPLRPRILVENVGTVVSGQYYWNWFYYELISTGLQPNAADNFLNFEMDTTYSIEYSGTAPLDKKQIVT